MNSIAPSENGGRGQPFTYDLIGSALVRQIVSATQ